MAALNFPDSPNVNDVFTVGSREWIWDGSAWVSNSGREYTRLISDTAPSSPIEGDEWFNSSTGKLYIYYDSYWLEVGASVSGVDGTDGADATLTRTIRSESANTSLVSGDANQVIRFTGTSAQVLTVDDVLSVGDRVEVIQDNSGQIEFSSGSGVTLLSTTGDFGTGGQNAKVELMCVAAGEYRLFGDLGAVAVPDLEYLVIAGGGSGGNTQSFSSTGGGGGGAGGYRSSVTGESSGGGASAESVFTFDLATNYTVTVGAGAPSITSHAGGTVGSNSIFNTITSNGGGGGGGGSEGADNGGSGGGKYSQAGTQGLGTTGQGFDGGSNVGQPAAGGGGAGQVGQGIPNSNDGGDGGDGVSSSITGSPISRAGGGGGAANPTGSGGSGGVGGGGAGSSGNNDNSTSGVANTGGGGGGHGPGDGGSSGAGGSGIVILRYPSAYSITIGAGLTGTENTDGDFKYAEITAGTGNVSFS